MIKDRRIIISVSIIAVLLLYLLLYNKDKKSGDIPKLKGWDSIDEILITNKNKQIKLYLKDNKWLINKEGYPADKTKVEKLEKILKDLEITDVVSKGHYYEKYNLTNDAGISISATKDGKAKRDLLVGKVSSTYRTTYVKFANDIKIYLADGNLTDEFNKDVDDLRDKQIFQVTRDDIAWFELMYQAKLTFEKKTEEIEVSQDNKKDKQKEKKKIDKWICKEFTNTEIDKNKVDSFLTSFSPIKADSFSDLKKKDMQGLLCSVKTKLFNKDIDIKIHKKDGDIYLCSSSESPYVFKLSDWNAKKYFKNIADFKQDVKQDKKNK